MLNYLINRKFLYELQNYLKVLSLALGNRVALYNSQYNYSNIFCTVLEC